ncbi:MFS transporter [Streptomyces sp. NPDC002659]|uniref:MFS transporter n=1 Tax=Streptomyces sp. NPDC002659 TaxID=3364656 RepID=UPI00367E1664
MTAQRWALRRVQWGTVAGALGNGLVLPFLYAYVTGVRGLGTGTAGMMFGVLALSGLAVLPCVGWVVDGRGPRIALVAGAGSAVAGALVYALAATLPTILAAAALLGAGTATVQATLSTMVACCSPPADRPRAFATQFCLTNLGLGAGGLAGGFLVDVSRPATFTVLFGLAILLMLALGVIAGSVTTAPPTPAERGGPGWRRVAGDRAAVRVLILGAVIFFTCYGQFESGLIALVTEMDHVSPRVVGAALTANTVVIFCGQLLVLRVLDGHRRSSVLALVGAVWMAAWAALAASGLARGTTLGAAIGVISAYGLLGVGEMLLAPTLGPLIVELAPSGWLGRYSAAFTAVKQTAVAAGPLAGGALIGARLYGPYLAALAGCTLAITGLSLHLRHHLSPAQDSLSGLRPQTEGPSPPES